MLVRILLLSFLLLNRSESSRRCEKQFRSNEIIWVWEKPSMDNDIAEFRNISIVLARRVRQLLVFELVD